MRARGVGVIEWTRTCPEMDKAQLLIVQALEKAGWEDMVVTPQTSGTRALENLIRIVTVALESNVQFVVQGGGFHGSGSLNRLAGLAGFKDVAANTGNPIMFLDDPKQGENGLDYRDSFARQMRVARNGNAKRVFLAESVLGVGGGRHVDPDSINDIAAEVKADGGLFILDAVQSSLRREGLDERLFVRKGTGTQDECKPDMVAISKGWAAGMGVAFSAANRKLVDQAKHNGLGGGNDTFSIQPAAAAAVIEVVDIYGDGAFQENLGAQTRQFHDRLQELVEASPTATDVSGDGMMLGIGFTDAESQAAALKKSTQLGLFVAPGGGNRIRLLPPTDWDNETRLKAEGILAGVLNANGQE